MKEFIRNTSNLSYKILRCNAKGVPHGRGHAVQSVYKPSKKEKKFYLKLQLHGLCIIVYCPVQESFT